MAPLKTQYSLQEVYRMYCKQTTQRSEMAPKACALCCGLRAQKQENELWTVAELAGFMRVRGLNIGRNRLHAWLRSHGYTDRAQRKGQNLPTRKALDRGWMVIACVEGWNRARDQKVRWPSIRVTPLGQAYFTGLFVLEGKGQ